MIEFERWLDDGDETRLADIEAYNEEDCLATLELRDWLLVQRDRGRGRVRGRDPVPGAARAARGEEGVGRGALGDDPPQGRPARGGGRPRRALARGAAPRLPPPRGAPGLVVVLPPVRDDRRGARSTTPRRSAAWSGTERLPRSSCSRSPTRFTFPPQQHQFDPDDTGGDPVDGRHGLDRHRARQRRRHGRPQARQRVCATSALPTALVPGGPYDTKAQRAALRRLAGSMLAERRPLPRPRTAAPPRPAARRRAGAAHGDRGAARPRSSASTRPTSSSRARPGRARRTAAPG